MNRREFGMALFTGAGALASSGGCRAVSAGPPRYVETSSRRGFTFPADARELLKERRSQFVGLGVDPNAIEQVGARLDGELWTDSPGSWPYEWSSVAGAAVARGDLLTASRAFGIAKYPCLGNEVHAVAYRRQLQTYLDATHRFPVGFERRVLDVAYRGARTTVPVHLLSPPGVGDRVPVVIRMGGVDTWKMDIHEAGVQLALALGVKVALLDQPGVGESRVANAPDGDLLLSHVVDQLRPLGNGKVAILGYSFGGYWAAKLALTGAVDVAVANGAPVEHAWEPDRVSRMPNGMPGILGNSLQRDRPFADADELAIAMGQFRFSVQGLLGNWSAHPTAPTPLLVINGDSDPYVPNEDVRLFASRPNTTIRLVPGATHCASEKGRELFTDIAGWLRERLG